MPRVLSLGGLVVVGVVGFLQIVVAVDNLHGVSNGHQSHHITLIAILLPLQGTMRAGEPVVQKVRNSSHFLYD